MEPLPNTRPTKTFLERYKEPLTLLHGDGHKVIPSSGGREEADFVAKTIAVPAAEADENLIKPVDGCGG